MSERSERINQHSAHAIARDEPSSERSERINQHSAHAIARDER